ncbi:MAG: hypothetical protein R2715_13820 [Ilumatobacteraceae bacterium]
MNQRGDRGLSRLERATLRVETPVRRTVGSNRLNPLPHAGTISVFLLGVVIFTGIYITLFFSFGFEASYHSVEKMHAHRSRPWCEPSIATPRPVWS